MTTPDSYVKLAWKSSGREHANDATRHALLALATVRACAFARLVRRVSWVG